MRKKPLTSKSGHVRELTGKDIRAMRPANEVLPGKLLDVLPKRKQGERGPQKNDRHQKHSKDQRHLKHQKHSRVA